MDTAILNGDWAVNANGIPVAIGGLQEQLQHALIRLSIKQGSFAYDPSLGSRLSALLPNDSDRNAAALFMAQEALKAMPQLTVERAECSDLPDGRLSVTVFLQTAEGNSSVTVSVPCIV